MWIKKDSATILDEFKDLMARSILLYGSKNTGTYSIDDGCVFTHRVILSRILTPTLIGFFASLCERKIFVV